MSNNLDNKVSVERVTNLSMTSIHVIESRGGNAQGATDNLNCTPEPFRKGFQGRPRQYDPHEFGLTREEQWQHPRMFRGMTFQTDAEAFNELRREQPQRQGLPPAPMDLSNLPEECLADLSAPSFNMTLPPEMSCADHENLMDVSAPSFVTSSPLDFQQQHQQQTARTMPSEYISDVSAPPLCDISIPSPLSPRADLMREEFIDDVSAPPLYQTGAHSMQQSPDTANDCSPSLLRLFRDLLRRFNDLSDRMTGRADNCTVGDEGGASILNQSQMHTDDMFGSDQIMSPEDLCNAQKVTTTTINGKGNVCLRETVLESSAVQNGGVHTSRRHVITRRNNNGNVTSHVQETNTLSNPSEQLDDMQPPSFPGHSPTGQTSAEGRCRNDAERKLNFSSPVSENLNDVSAPSMFDCTLESGMQTSYPSENIHHASMPSFYDASMRPSPQQYPSECLEDISAPSFRNTSMTPGPTHQTPSPCTMINDISAPSFRTPGSTSMPSECLEATRMPSYATVSTPSRPQMNMRSECLDDISAPSFRSPNTRKMPQRQMPSPCQNINDISAPSFKSTGSASMPCECLDDITMPSMANVSMSSRPQMNFPSECLEDISAPSFRSTSVRQTPQRQMPSPCQNINDISAPSFKSTGSASMPSECLDDITMPSMANVSMSSRPQMHFPSECLEDISAPSFRSTSVRQTPQRQMPSPCQNINDISAPSFKSTGSASMPSECLDDITMPSMANVSMLSIPQMNLPSECLEDISAPSFRSTPPRLTPQQRMPSPCPMLCDISAPSFRSTDPGSMPSQYLDDVTMPSYANFSMGSRPQSRLPSECLDDVSAPSLVRSMSRNSPPLRRYRSMPLQQNQNISGPSFRSRGSVSMPSECIEDISMPSFGNATMSSRRQPTLPSECIEDISAPSFGTNTYTSNQNRYFRRQRSLPSPQICDISEPSYRSTGPSFTRSVSRNSPTHTDYNGRPATRMFTPARRAQRISRTPQQQISAISAPSFNSSAERTPIRNYQYPSQNISSISAPSYYNTCSCLGSGSVADSSYPPRSPNYPSEQLANVSMPSFGFDSRFLHDRSIPQRGFNVSVPSEYIQNVSAPTFARSNSSRHPEQPQFSLPREQICDVSAPSFRSVGPATMSLPSSRPGDFGMPSYQNISEQSHRSNRGATIRSEYIADISAPSFASSRQSPHRRSRSLPREQICDESCPLYRNPAPATPPMPSSLLEDVSMPSYRELSSTPRRHLPYFSLPSECIDDMSAPTFNSSRSHSTFRRSRSLPKEQSAEASALHLFRSGQMPTGTTHVDDMSQPTFASTGPMAVSHRKPTYPSECLADISAPSFDQTPPLHAPQHAAQRSLATRMSACQACANISDISEPTYYSTGASRGRGVPEQNYPSECLDDVTEPSLSATRRRGFYVSTSDMPSENLQDISEPSRLRNHTMMDLADGREPSYHSIAPSSSGHTDILDDITMPSTLGHTTQAQSACECGDNKDEPSQRTVASEQQTGHSLSHLDLADVLATSAFDGSCLDTSVAVRTISQPSIIQSSRASEDALNESKAALIDEEVEELQVTTSISSTTRIYTNMPSERILNTSMPSQYEFDTEPGSEHVSNISQPMLAPSYASTAQSFGASGNAGGTRRRAAPRRGFDTMPNYAPIDEQLRTPSRSAQYTGSTPSWKRSASRTSATNKRSGKGHSHQGHASNPNVSSSSRTPARQRPSPSAPEQRRSLDGPCQEDNTNYSYEQPNCVPRNRKRNNSC